MWYRVIMLFLKCLLYIYFFYVYVAPVKFIQKTKQIQVKLNDDAHIQCIAVGDKPLQISWKGSTNVPILKDIDRR